MRKPSKIRGVITTKATKAAALVDFWDYKKCHKQLGRFEEKNIFTFPKQKNSLNILFFFAGLKWLSFYQEKNLLKHTGSSLQNWRKKYFHFSDSIKKTFWISWIFFAGFKKWIFYYPTKQKTSLNILKWVKTNLTFSWHSGFEGHKFLHFLSHFGKKKIKKDVPRPGFEPAIIRIEGQRANHFTMMLTTTPRVLNNYMCEISTY